MADVPLTVAVISTVSPVVAGALPLIIGWIREAGREKREQVERLAVERLRLEQEKRGECVKLLRLARDFRVLLENTYESRGSDLAARAQQIRQAAADITGQADEVGFMVPAAEATASSLATEACSLAGAIADINNRALGASILSPDFTRFDKFLAEFKLAAQAALDDRAAFIVDSAGKEGDRELPRLHTAVGPAQERLG
jgi:triphosphoribosyl-dephospho-CoA synthetase